MVVSYNTELETDVHFVENGQAKIHRYIQYGEGGKQLTRSMRTRLTLDLH